MMRVSSLLAASVLLFLAHQCAARELDQETWLVDEPKHIRPRPTKDGSEPDHQQQVRHKPSPERLTAPPTQYEGILALHNSYRATHQAPALVWDTALADETAAYAANCNFEHGAFGENLYVTTATNNVAAALTNAVNAWYNEVVEYTWTQPGFSPATGHFTQVVWRGSSMLGCAAQVCLNNITGTNFPRGTLVICRYLPPGNVQGQFAANVWPPLPPPPATIIESGATLTAPGCFTSLNKVYSLCLRRDTRLMLVQNTTQGRYVLWSSGKDHKPAGKTLVEAKFSFDGRLKLLDDVQGMLWSSENEASKGTPPRKLALTDEGNLVIFDRNNVPLWQTHTKGYDNLKSAAAAAALLARH